MPASRVRWCLDAAFDDARLSEARSSAANQRATIGARGHRLPPGKSRGRICARVLPFVAIVSVLVAALFPGVTLVSVNVPVAAAGRPEADSATAFGKPPVPGVTVMVYDALLPDVTVTEGGAAD